MRRAKADKHAEGFVKDLAQRAGVTIEADAPTKSDIYREMMPWMTSGKCRLPPLDRLVNQIFGLERTSRRRAYRSPTRRPRRFGQRGLRRDAAGRFWFRVGVDAALAGAQCQAPDDGA